MQPIWYRREELLEPLPTVDGEPKLLRDGYAAAAAAAAGVQVYPDVL